MSDKEFLNWLAERLVEVYKESPNVDFVHRLRKIASAPAISYQMDMRDGVHSLTVFEDGKIVARLENPSKMTMPGSTEGRGVKLKRFVKISGVQLFHSDDKSGPYFPASPSLYRLIIEGDAVAFELKQVIDLECTVRATL